MNDAEQVIGPEVLVPGSDFLLGGLGRLMVVVGAVAIVVVALRWRRRLRRGSSAPTPSVRFVLLGAVVLTGLVLSLLYRPPAFFVPRFPPLPELQPAGSLFRRSVLDLPVHPDSARMIASQGDLPLGPGFSGTVVDGVVWGIPFNVVGPDTALVDVELTQYPDTSFPGPYPITDPAYIEGLPTYHFDQHYVAVDPEAGRVWELIAVRRWFGRWQAGAGARWDTDSLEYPEGATIAAGLPLLPGTISYDEVESGSIDHLLLGASPITAAGRFVWPARGTDGRSDDPDAPPMGTWLRLRQDVDLTGLGPQARVIADAARRYGVLLSDTGPGFGLRGTPDARWDDRDLATLAQLSTSDFEVVDTTEMMVAPNSMAANPPQDAPGGR